MTSTLINNTSARHIAVDATIVDKDFSAAASKSAKTADYIRVANTVHSDVQAVSYNARETFEGGAPAGRPRLAPPPATAQADTSEDRFTFLMATLMSLLGEVEITSLKNRLSILRSMADASAKGNQELSARYLSAVAELEAAVGAASSSLEKLEAAKANVESARRELAAAETRLASAEPGSPEHDAALVARDQAQGKLNTANQVQATALKAYTAAAHTATQAASKAEALAKEATAGQLDPKTEQGLKQQLDASSTMLLLMMKFAELMGESAENKMEAEQALFRSMQASRQEYMDKKSDEYLEQVRSAEAANKTMGCIGKWVGIALAVVSVIAVPFTGGASLALGAIGIGLMAADMLIKELTGVSFMAEAMKPLMDHVLGPLIQAIGKVITDALMSMGVDEKAAKMVGGIIGAVIGAIAMVAIIVVVAVVGKGAASRVASSMGNMLSKMVSKMVPEMLKNAAKTVANIATRAATSIRSSVGLSSDKLALQTYGNRFAMMATATETAGAGAQAGFAVKSGIHQSEAAKSMAEVSLAAAISEQLRTYLSVNVQNFEDAMQAQSKFLKQVSNIQHSYASTGLAMARNI